jgi:hypothetical protein
MFSEPEFSGPELEHDAENGKVSLKFRFLF